MPIVNARLTPSSANALLLGVAASSSVAGSVEYYADLDINTPIGEIYRVEKRTVNYWTLGFTARHLAGFYEKTGNTTWQILANASAPAYDSTEDTTASTNYRMFATKDINDIAVAARDAITQATGTDLSSPQNNSAVRRMSPDNVYDMIIDTLPVVTTPILITATTTFIAGKTYYMSSNVSSTASYQFAGNGTITIMGNGYELKSSHTTSTFYFSTTADGITVIAHDLFVYNSYSAGRGIYSTSSAWGRLIMFGGGIRGTRRVMESLGSISYYLTGTTLKQDTTAGNYSGVILKQGASRAPSFILTSCLWIHGSGYAFCHISGVSSQIAFNGVTFKILGSQGASTPIRFSNFNSNLLSNGLFTFIGCNFHNTYRTNLVYSETKTTWKKMAPGQIRHVSTSGTVYTFTWVTGTAGGGSSNYGITNRSSTTEV